MLSLLHHAFCYKIMLMFDMTDLEEMMHELSINSSF